MHATSKAAETNGERDDCKQGKLEHDQGTLQNCNSGHGEALSVELVTSKLGCC